MPHSAVIWDTGLELGAGSFVLSTTGGSPLAGSPGQMFRQFIISFYYVANRKRVSVCVFVQGQLDQESASVPVMTSLSQ